MKAKRPAVRRPPPPRTVVDALDLLKERGDAVIESPVALALLTKDQLTDVLERYARWKAETGR